MSSTLVKYVLKDEISPEIYNYESLLENPRSLPHVLKYFTFFERYSVLSSIDNDTIINHLCNYPRRIQKDLFSANPNDKAVDFLFHNSEYIDYNSFQRNTNIRVVERFIKNKAILNSNFSSNCSDAAVKWLIKNPEYIHAETFCDNENPYIIPFLKNNQRFIVESDNLCRNPDSFFVDYYINNVDKMGPTFNCNTNDVAVQYLIDNEQHQTRLFSKNTNSLAVQYLIDNPKKIDYFWFGQNTNDLAVDFLIKTRSKWLSLNPTRRAISFLKKNPELIDFSIVKYNKAALELIINDIDKIGLFHITNMDGIFEINKRLIYKQSMSSSEIVEYSHDHPEEYISLLHAVRVIERFFKNK